MRVKRGTTAHRRHKKILKATKGFHAKASRTYVHAFEAWMKSGTDAYRQRKVHKRNMRGLWITRLNAAARANGTTYSKLISALTAQKITLNRKMLSEIAIHEPEAFATLVKMAKK